MLLIIPYPGWSQEQEYDLGKIVVTATRTEMEATKTPGSVSVVTKKDVEKRNIQVVDQALNTVAGVLNRRGKGLMETMVRVTLRGMPEQQRTLILMDGLPLNSAYSGNVSFGGIALEDIERIEVVKGPFSSLYGGNAMGGVVNIITKTPRKREFVLNGGYGSDALWKSYISYGDRFKDMPLSLFLSYGYKSTDGYITDFNVQSTKPTVTGWSYTTDKYGNTCYLIGDKGNNEYWDQNITVKTGYDFSQSTKLKFSFLRNQSGYSYYEPHTHLRDAAGNPVWSYTVGTTTVRESTFLSGDGQDKQDTYNLSYETEFSTLKAKLSLGLVDLMSWNITPGTTATTTRFGGPGKIAETPSESYNSEIQFSLPLFKRHIFTFGGSFRYNWADTEEHNLDSWKDKGSKTTLSYEARGKDRTFALFIQDELEILDNLSLYLGFREDWWKTYDGYTSQVTTGYLKDYGSHSASSFSPKLALVYEPFVKTTLRTSVGQAFRPPTIYELYRTWTSSSGVTYAGNPELNPEKTTSWDLGIEQGLWKGSKIKATYFENYVKDLIYNKTLTNTYERINAGKAEIRGIEVELEQRFDLGLRLFANLTYNEDANVKKNEAKPETESKWLTDVPERMFNAGVELTKGNFSGSLVARYVSKRYSDDQNRDTANDIYTSFDPYLVTDLKLSYKFTKFATLSFSVDNIFDKDYFVYYKAPGRKWFTELTLKF